MFTTTWESRRRFPVSKRFQMPRDGEWLRPVANRYTVACCDCGSVHKVDFRIVDGHVELRAYRAPRETRLLRRLELKTALA
jgi:hypothetical protein